MNGDPIQGKLLVTKATKSKPVMYRVEVTTNGKQITLAVPGHAKGFKDTDAVDKCVVNVVLSKGQAAKVTIPEKEEVSGVATVRTGPGGGSNRGGHQVAAAPRDPAAVDATAPYNFISAEKMIGYPEQRTGPLFSGTIQCTLKALTPLLVAGATDKAEVDAAEREKRPVKREFFKVNNIPTIPGASLKGMLRAVIEILSAAPMFGQVNDRAIGFRDVAGGDAVPYGKRMRGGNGEVLTAGFLKVVGSDRSITPCEFVRVESTNTNDSAANKIKTDLARPYPRSVMFKPSGRMDASGISVGEIVTTATPGLTQGQCVFTGPMPGRDGPKSLDYIFHTPAGNDIKVEETVWDAFQDQLTVSQNNVLGQYRTNHLPQPVFFLRNTVGGTDTITALGLARFFRLTSRHRTGKLAKDLSATDGIGLPERIFGRVGTRAQAGRVQVSCGTPSNGTPPIPTQFPDNGGLVAGNPAASAVAMYLEQDTAKVLLRKGNTEVNEGLANFDGVEAPILRGRKLYWHQKDPRKPRQPNNNHKVQAIYFPLGRAVFDFSVSVDRIDKMELGALIASIALPETSAHKLGLGKAFGLGSVRVEIEWDHSTISPIATRYASLKDRASPTPGRAKTLSTPALKEFQDFVALQCGVGSFEEVPHVLDFRRMTEFKNPPHPDKIKFMELSPNDGSVSYKRKAILGAPKTLMPPSPIHP